MLLSHSDSRRGFTLIELLVAISVVLLLSGLTLGSIRASRRHQVLAQAAARFEMLIELAQTMAISESEDVYLVIADHQSEPPGIPMRAYTFIKNLDNPQLLHHWQFLPDEVVFAGDAHAPDVDLIETAPLQTLPNAFRGQTQTSRVEGAVRVLVKLTPDGTLLSGAGEELQPASLLIERGSWVTDAALNSYYVPQHTVEEQIPLDAVRILFRPRSGRIELEEAGS